MEARKKYLKRRERKTTNNLSGSGILTANQSNIITTSNGITSNGILTANQSNTITSSGITTNGTYISSTNLNGWGNLNSWGSSYNYNQNDIFKIYIWDNEYNVEINGTDFNFEELYEINNMDYEDYIKKFEYALKNDFTFYTDNTMYKSCYKIALKKRDE